MLHLGAIKNDISSRKVVLLIGSTRFHDEFIETSWKLTKDEGCIVLLPNFRPSSMMDECFDISEDTLEDIGYCKIDFADEVYVVNVDGYIGSSTSKEIDYAKSIGKPIRYYHKEV